MDPKFWNTRPLEKSFNEGIRWEFGRFLEKLDHDEDGQDQREENPRDRDRDQDGIEEISRKDSGSNEENPADKDIKLKVKGFLCIGFDNGIFTA